MPVITISRGTYSGGRDLAECVARELGFPCISREVIVEAAGQYGVSEASLAEAMASPPGFFERFSSQRDIYVKIVRSVLCQNAARGPFVYHGNAGHLLLSHLPHVIRVRIVAPMEFRITAAVERMGFSRKEAELHIHKVDRQREKWTRFLYGESWTDPSLYDLVINLENLEISEACRVVRTLAGAERYEWTEESRKVVADFALAARVTAELAIDERTKGADLEVAAHSGAVEIQGKVGPGISSSTIQEVAQGVDGVESVRCDLASPAELPG